MFGLIRLTVTTRVWHTKRRGRRSAMARRILVVTTAASPQAEVERVVREHGGEDAELHVIAPASKISWLDRWTNDEGAARADAAERAEAAADAAPADAEPHVGD